MDADYIYPVICKKYLVLLPHDYKSVDDTALAKVKQMYKSRCERFNSYINSDLEICLIYCNIDYNLNSWQKSVYAMFSIDISILQKENHFYLGKIKELYKAHSNITVIAFEDYAKKNIGQGRV